MEGPDGVPDTDTSGSRAYSAGPAVGKRLSNTADQAAVQEEPEESNQGSVSGLRVAILVCPWVSMLHGLDPSSLEARSEVDPTCVTQCVDIKDKTSIEITSQTKTAAGVAVVIRDFCFHGCYQSQQQTAVQEIFDDLVAPVIEHLFDGNSGTILAYGQMGTGKSQFMNGTPDTQGLIEIAAGVLFESGLGCTASYIEVYNDGAIDLLDQQRASPRRRPSSTGGGGGGGSKANATGNKPKVLRIREHAINGPYAEGKKTASVSSVETLRALLATGDALRHTRRTEQIPYNSSRSHTILTLETALSDGQGVSLNFVDLAGTGQGDATVAFPTSPDVLVWGGLAAAAPPPTSPTRRPNFRVGAATQKKMFATEATAISKSLATLSQVVHMLVKQSLVGSVSGGGGGGGSAGSKRNNVSAKQIHVPFRGSALTWLLKPAFGGASKNTVIVATISPAMQHCDETLATLRWAEQSMRIVAKPRAAAVCIRTTISARPRSTPEPRRIIKVDQAWTGKFPALSASQSDPSLRRRRHSTSSLQGNGKGGSGRSSASTAPVPLPFPSVSKRRNSTNSLSLDHGMETIMSSPSPSPTERVAQNTSVSGSRRNRGLRTEQPTSRIANNRPSPHKPATAKATRGASTHASGVSNRMQRVFGNFANHRDTRGEYSDSDPELDDDVGHSPSGQRFDIRGPDISAGRPIKYRPSGPKGGRGARTSRQKSRVPILPAVEMPSVEKLFYVLPNMAKKPKPQRLKLNFAASFKRVATETSKESTDQIKYISPKNSPEKESPQPPSQDDTNHGVNHVISDLERVMNQLTATEDLKRGTPNLPTPPSALDVAPKRTRRRSSSSQKESIRTHPAPPAADSPKSTPRRRRSSSTQDGVPSTLSAAESPRRSSSPRRRKLSSSSQVPNPPIKLPSSSSIAVADNLLGATDATATASASASASAPASASASASALAPAAVPASATAAAPAPASSYAESATSAPTASLKSNRSSKTRPSKPTQVAAPPSGTAPAGGSRRKGKQRSVSVTSSSSSSSNNNTVGQPSPTVAGEAAEYSPINSAGAVTTDDGAADHDDGVVDTESDGDDSEGTADVIAADAADVDSVSVVDDGRPPSPNPYTKETAFAPAKDASVSITERINDGHQRGAFLSATTEMAIGMFADPSTISFAKLGMKNAGFANMCVGSWFSMIVHLDLSENIIQDEACDCIAGVIKAGRWPVLATLILDGGPIQPAVSDDGAVAIVNALQTCTTIEKLSLRMNQLSALVSLPVADLVTKTKSLRSLNLYANKLRDTGGLEVVHAMQLARTVVDLDLSDNSFSESGGLEVVHVLASNPACRKIGLGWNYVGGELGNALQKLIDGHRRLTHLNLQWSNLGSGTAALCKAVVKSTKLLALDVSHNNLGPQGGILIADALTQNNTLVELNLLENSFDEDSGIALGTMLTVNTGLKSLNLSYNDLGRAGGEAIADALAGTLPTATATAAAAAAAATTTTAGAAATTPATMSSGCNTTLRSLYMNGVKSVTMASRIKLLSWSDTRVDNDVGGGSAVGRSPDVIAAHGDKRHLEIDNRAKIAMARSATENDPTVVELDLQNCKLTDADAEWLELLLSSNTHIVELNLNRNKLGKLAAAAVERALPTNTTLKRASLQSNPFEADAISTLQRARVASQQCTLKFDAEPTEPWG